MAAYTYLVEEKGKDKPRLLEAGAPATAIAHCAKDTFTAQRVEGAVLKALIGSGMKVEKITTPAPAAPAADAAAGNGSGDGKEG